MVENTISVTPEGEMHIKVGRCFGLDEAVLCMRNCPHTPGGQARRVVFDLLGTQLIQTAGLGFMLMVKERCQLSRENAVVLYDSHHIGQMLYLAHFEEKFHLVRHGGERPAFEAAAEEQARAGGAVHGV